MTDCKIFLEQELPEDGRLIVRDEFAEHYLVNVRRLSSGDRLLVAGTNQVADAIFCGKNPVTLNIESVRPVQPLNWDLRIYQAITRKKKFEETIKRGTELGVTQFIPVITDRTVRVPNNPAKQRRRWRKIATDSARISERDSLPTIGKPQSFDDARTSAEGRIYRADPQGNTMRDIAAQEPDSVDGVSIFVGPEGGYTTDEKEKLDSVATSTVRAGQRNLRAETASVALISLWLGEKGHL